MHTWNGLCSWRKYAPGASTSLNICSVIMSYKNSIWVAFPHPGWDQKPLDCCLEKEKRWGCPRPEPTRWQPWFGGALWCLAVLLPVPTPPLAFFWDLIKKQQQRWDTDCLFKNHLTNLRLLLVGNTWWFFCRGFIFSFFFFGERSSLTRFLEKAVICILYTWLHCL